MGKLFIINYPKSNQTITMPIVHDQSASYLNRFSLFPNVMCKDNNIERGECPTFQHPVESHIVKL